MSERDVHEALHKAWLAVHIERFSAMPPDCTYNGVRLAETAIAKVAAEYGIDWLALRRPSLAASSSPASSGTSAEGAE